MYNKNSSVASLLNSRICHDLANPLGAISNGLELMELSGAARTPEFEMTASSIQNANAKLNFFRIAFGPSDGKDISHVEISRILSDVYRDTRCVVTWQISSDISRDKTKLMMLLVLCLESALPRGGVITLSKDGETLKATATGAKILCNADDWDHLSGKTIKQDLEPSGIQFELARTSLAEYESAIQINETDTSIQLIL